MAQKQKKIFWPAAMCAAVSIPLFMFVFNHVHFPYFFFDEKFYIELAQSFNSFHRFVFEGEALHPLRILYSVIISPAFYFSDFNISYKLIQWFNHLVFSLSVIPVFLLTKQLSKNNTYAFLISIAVLVMPGRLYANVALPESLFLFLFLFCVYFFWKFICEPNFPTCFFSIFFFLLCFFTKQQCLLLIPVFALTFLLELIFRKKKKMFIIFLCISGLFLISGIVFVLQKKLFVHYTGLFSLKPKSLITSYKCFAAQFLVLGWITGLLPLIYLFLSLKDLKKLSNEKRIFILLTVFTVVGFWFCTSLYLAVQNAKYIHADLFARYYIAFVPLIWIAAVIVPEKAKQFNKQSSFEGKDRRMLVGLRGMFSIIIFCCLSAWILPPFVAERVDENALSISGWFYKAEFLWQTGFLIGIFLFAWSAMQLIFKGKKSLYMLIIGLIILTCVASNRQKKYAESFSETAVPISEWLNKNVAEKSPLIYAGGGFDKSLFLTELLVPRRMERYLFITNSKNFRYVLLDSSIFFGTKYILAPNDLKIPGKRISSFNNYNLFKIEDDALKRGESGDIKVVGVNEFGIITGTNFIIAIAYSENVNELKLKLKFDTRDIKSQMIELKSVQGKRRTNKTLKITGGIEPCSFKLYRNDQGIFKIEITIPKSADKLILNNIKIRNVEK